MRLGSRSEQRPATDGRSAQLRALFVRVRGLVSVQIQMTHCYVAHCYSSEATGCVCE